jgi:hypothetical protein
VLAGVIVMLSASAAAAHDDTWGQRCCLSVSTSTQPVPVTHHITPHDGSTFITHMQWCKVLVYDIISMVHPQLAQYCVH